MEYDTRPTWWEMWWTSAPRHWKIAVGIFLLTILFWIVMGLQRRLDARAEATYPRLLWVHQVGDGVTLHAIETRQSYTCYVAVGEGPWSGKNLTILPSKTVAVDCYE